MEPKQPTRLLLICFIIFLVSIMAIAQESKINNPAKTEDVASLDAIIETLYAVISGDKGVVRDWGRFLSLFHQDSKLIPSRRADDGQISLRYMSPAEYVESSGPYLENNGFFEREIARQENHFGNLVHIWSTYESFHTKDDPNPFSRGINSIQLLNDGDRWWIVNIYWTSEREDNPIPDIYLGTKGR